MSANRRALTIFQITPSIDGADVSSFDQVVQASALTDPQLQTTELPAGFDFDGRLYVIAPAPEEPRWGAFLREGFGDTFNLSATATNRALLVIRFRYYNADRYFAVAFGAGRHLMRRDAYVRSFGLKAALNLIYEDDVLDGSASSDRVRQVDSRTVAGNTFRTRRQANRDTTFEQFGLDTERDLLSTVTGEPSDRTELGSRVFGADHVGVNLPIDFSGLVGLCKRLWRAGRADDYETHFSWIDNLSAIAEPARLEALRSAVVQQLRDGAVGAFELAPPELVDFDAIETFRIEVGANDVSVADLTLSAYLALFDAGGLAALTWDRMKSHRVAALSAQGELLHRWPVSDCLFGELDDDGETVLLDAAEFFAVAADFLADLDAFVAAIPESDVDLPDSRIDANGREISEGVYNVEAAQHLPTHLLLDKRTVRVAPNTSSIEICDVLTTDRKFVHVKRKLGSASLSHLFSQGYVSGDLFVTSHEYRTAVAAEIAAAEADKGSGPIFTNALDFQAPDPAAIEVVYAVVANWNGDSVVDRLPFFSKVNLRRHATDLRRLGYEVTFKRIDIA